MNWHMMGWTFTTATWAAVTLVNTRFGALKVLAVVAVLDAIAGFILAAIS